MCVCTDVETSDMICPKKYLYYNDIMVSLDVKNVYVEIISI